MKLFLLVLALALAGCVTLREPFQGKPEVPIDFHVVAEMLWFEDQVATISYRWAAECGLVPFSFGEYNDMTKREIIEATYGEVQRGRGFKLPCAEVKRVKPGTQP